jgi:NADPH2:quinone reductase
MKAAYVTKPGPPESIIIGDLPTPEPTGDQVLVRVKAAAVNPIDTYVRSGVVKMDIPLPYIVGADLAGVVEKMGQNAKKFKVGDRVWGTDQGLMGRQGTFAEYAAVEERWLYPIPTGVTDETAAACALVGITAAIGLVRDAKLQAGETLFVNGGTGGVGSMVVQMAKVLSARVIATAGSDEKVKLCLEGGADAAINYKQEDVPARVKELAPNGVDVWWETIREPNFEQTVPLLAKRGRMILMAGRDARPVFPVGPFYTKDCRLLGFAMFNATREEQDAAAADINRWLAAGKLKPRIDRVLPLDKTAEAHRLQEESTVGKSGGLAGKIIIKP